MRCAAPYVTLACNQTITHTHALVNLGLSQSALV